MFLLLGVVAALLVRYVALVLGLPEELQPEVFVPMTFAGGAVFGHRAGLHVKATTELARPADSLGLVPAFPLFFCYFY